jgi:DHA1 family bicyclomycin/chloramphenicol resistance-like MFS transporter
LILARLLQGIVGGVVGVVATAVVRDRYAGKAAARFYSLLFLVTLLSPLFAPAIGGEVLLVTPWRGIFIVLAAIGLLLLSIALLGFPETLPRDRRRTGGIAESVRTLGRLAADREFLGFALPSALATGAIFTYLAGSAFVLEDIYHVTPQVYGLLFALNGIALGISTQVNRWLLIRFRTQDLFQSGLIGLACGGSAMLLGILFGVPGVLAVVGPVMLIVASNGFVGPNSLALALTPHPDAAGSGSALMGSLRFAVGGAAGPLVGLFGATSAVPLAAAMCSLTAGALLVSFVGRPRAPGRHSPS